MVGAVSVEQRWLAFPDIKSGLSRCGAGEIFATVEEKYGKCRTFDGRPQTISFQDVERGALRGSVLALCHLCVAAFKAKLENQI